MPHTYAAEQEERRMSDLSDWASSVTSAADNQQRGLVLETGKLRLRRNHSFEQGSYFEFEELAKEALNRCKDLEEFSIELFFENNPFLEEIVLICCCFSEETFYAVANNMPELLSLTLVGIRITNDGLEAILDGCQCATIGVS
ncbi:hypothetical protein FRX31_015368 [Thalictrum thalictroides]|uniref:Uncharacterized protein n=1 Tax=Thalictrum thalictroides TaxID=46969 RepID=A0A7J6WDR0_THATH|nr:hypothetical protein FRX31_015368 [Thalictrum thalictroides]